MDEPIPSKSLINEFFVAVSKGDISRVTALLVKDERLLTQVDQNGLSALNRATLNNNAEMVSFLLDQGIPIELGGRILNENHNAVAFADFHKKKGIVTLIQQHMDAQKPMDLDGEQYQLFQEDEKIPEEVLMQSYQTFEARSDSEAFREKFFIAVLKNNTELIISLLENNPELVKLKNERGHTALHMAVHQENPALARLLINYGHIIDHKDDENEATPLHHAAFAGNLEMVALLLELGASIDVFDKFNKTPLQIAKEKMSKDDFTVVEGLLSFKKPDPIPTMPPLTPISTEDKKPEIPVRTQLLQSEFIRSNKSKGVANLSAADLGRCLYEIMQDVTATNKPPQIVKPMPQPTPQLTPQSKFTPKPKINVNVKCFGDWFIFNDKTSLDSATVSLQGESKPRTVIVSGSLVKSSVTYDDSGKGKVIPKEFNYTVDSYPSLSAKLLAMAKREPNNKGGNFETSDFIYNDEGSQTPSYDRLLASDLLNIARGQKPVYYTDNTDVQFLTEVAVLLFGVENIAIRDSSNTQLGANLLLLDMICKKQKYGKDLQHYFRLQNFLDSGKLVDHVWHYKKTETYPWQIDLTKHTAVDKTDLQHDLELSSLPSKASDAVLSDKQRNDFAPSATYTLISGEQHAKDLKTRKKDLKKADTVGGISPSTTGTYTNISSGIYGEKNKFLRNVNLDKNDVLKDDASIEKHRIVLKENKILYYWLKQNSPDCFVITPTPTKTKVKQALSQGLGEIIDQPYKLTALHYDILQNNPIDVSKIDSDALSVKDERGFTALHYLVAKNKYQLLAQLMSRNKLDLNNLNIRDFQGRTPLFLAVASGDASAVNMLLAAMKMKANALLLVPDMHGDTALHIAAKKSDIKLMYKLLSADNTMDSCMSRNSFNQNSLLHSAILGGNKDMVQFLTQHFSSNFLTQGLINSPNAEGDTPLHLAIKRKDAAAIDALLNTKNINLLAQNKNGDTPLHLAIAANNLALVDHILSTGVGRKSINIPNAAGNTALNLAAIADNPGMIDSLLMHGANVKSQDKTFKSPLLTAMVKRNVNAVCTLFEAGVTIENDKGNTPLHYLASSKSKIDIEHIERSASIIKLFAKDINTPNKSGATPLLTAIQRGNFSIALALIEAGANPNIADIKGHTALHSVIYEINAAVSQRATLTVELKELTTKMQTLKTQLLEAKDDKKITPQQKQIWQMELVGTQNAIKRRQEKIEALLIKEKTLEILIRPLLVCGAKIDQQDKLGYTPFKLASVAEPKKVLVLLEQLSALSKDQIEKIVNTPDNSGNYLLHTIMSITKLGQVGAQALLEIGADRFAKNANGDTPLHLAVTAVNLPCIYQLFRDMSREKIQELMTTPNNKGVTPQMLIDMMPEQSKERQRLTNVFKSYSYPPEVSLEQSGEMMQSVQSAKTPTLTLPKGPVQSLKRTQEDLQREEGAEEKNKEEEKKTKKPRSGCKETDLKLQPPKEDDGDDKQFQQHSSLGAVLTSFQAASQKYSSSHPNTSSQKQSGASYQMSEEKSQTPIEAEKKRPRGSFESSSSEDLVSMYHDVQRQLSEINEQLKWGHIDHETATSHMVQLEAEITEIKERLQLHTGNPGPKPKQQKVGSEDATITRQEEKKDESSSPQTLHFGHK